MSKKRNHKPKNSIFTLIEALQWPVERQWMLVCVLMAFGILIFELEDSRFHIDELVTILAHVRKSLFEKTQSHVGGLDIIYDSTKSS